MSRPLIGTGRIEEPGALCSESQQRRAADCDRDLKFQKLGATRAEGVSVHELLGGTLLLGQEASVSRFKRIQAPGILHVATRRVLSERPSRGLLDTLLGSIV